MAGDETSEDLKAEELSEVIRDIRERVRARHPEGTAGDGVVLPDLVPILHARDAAASKVAAIGTVNPRPPGAFNALIQAVKKLIARALDWHVREQVEFNRALMISVEAILGALNENNRALVRLAEGKARLNVEIGQLKDESEQSKERAQELAQRAQNLGQRAEELTQRAEELKQDAEELKDIRAHWSQWRQEWERKLAVNEVQFLRSVADLQAAFQHRTTLMESSFRELIRSQHQDFTGALERSVLETQKRLWADLEKVRGEFEKLIHTELRLIRQHVLVARGENLPAPSSALADLPLPFDYARFAERFRGSEEYVKENQRFYVPFFQDRTEVLDIGCGRGEFLELMKEAGVEACGIDLSAESVELCRAKGLRADAADVFAYLTELPDCSLDGIFCAQVVEHLPRGRLPEMIRLASAKLATGGLLAIETPNPECLAVFAAHFYLDPTHAQPVPSSLLRFYMEEAGLGRIEVHELSPAVESMSSLASLPEDFREAFFGGLDYAILGRKL